MYVELLCEQLIIAEWIKYVSSGAEQASSDMSAAAWLTASTPVGPKL
jgi:hypothetical protein